MTASRPAGKAHLGLMVCENLLREFAAVIEGEGWADVVLTPYGARCGKPSHLNWKEVEGILGAGGAAHGDVLLLGCFCLADLQAPPPGLAGCQVRWEPQCFHLLLPRDLVEHLQEQGCHLMSPGWLARWQEQMQTWGFDQGTAREFFGETTRRLVLLDTGVDPESPRHLEEMGTFLGLPWERLPVGLEFLRTIVRQHVLEREMAAEKARAAEKLARANRELADYAMAHEVMGGLKVGATEQQVIDYLLDLLTTLFAPHRIDYLTVIDGEAAGTSSQPANPCSVPATGAHLLSFSDEYAWTEDESGFVLRIGEADMVLGVLQVQGFAFPEHRQHYLNLALGLVNVWALAVNNARTYARLAQANADLRVARDVAEGASRAKSTFLANMSHEIRTPMNAIMGLTDLVLDTRLTREQGEYLSTVRTSADSLLALLNQVLDYSKIEAGRLALESTHFRLRDLVEDTVTGLAFRAHTRGIELASHLLPDVPEDLVGDPVRLRQVLVNLVGNSLKFTHAGEIVVRVSREQDAGEVLAAEAPPPKDPRNLVLHFEVSDTGIGIPLSKQKAIFEAFTQADGSTTREYGGTGLGLAICAEIVEAMGGRIWVDSVPERGSTFHFTARFQSPTARPGTPPVRAEDLVDLPVLVVDDNETNRRILQETLLGWRMKPTVVQGGKAALEALEEAARAGLPYELVLLDAMMPGMDGFEVARRIHGQPSLTVATVLVLSSADRIVEARELEEIGVSAWLLKPIRQSKLLEAILGVLPTLPARRCRRPQAPPTPPPLPASRLRILVADDNPTNRLLATRLLEKRGHHVVTVSGGPEVLTLLGREDFDVALVDVQMPEMDGFEVTDRVRSEEAKSDRHLPILAMTAHAVQGYRERCIEAGMDGYVAKPIDPFTLFAAVERYCKPNQA